MTRDFAQNFRDARSGRDLATINRRAPWRPQRRRRKRLRSGIVPRQRRVLGIPRVDLHALAAPRPAQGWRRTDRSPQTSVASYVWRTPPFLANGRNAVKPGLFCEPSGRVAGCFSCMLVCYMPLARHTRAKKASFQRPEARSRCEIHDIVSPASVRDSFRLR